MKRTCRDEKGFTLLELLIAMVLFSIILSAIYGSFFLSHKAMTGLDESLLKLQECRTAIDVMTREGESILYKSSNMSSLVKVEDKDFYGKQASRFTFTAFSPLSYGIVMISYYVEDKDGVLTLFKKMDSAYKPDNTTKGEELIEGLESFSVEVNDGSKWVKTWDTSETKQPPLEIRITITAKIKDRPVSFFDTVRRKIGNTI
ncbi:MAG: prepilin-type N-terminal cleavage/methylation domain-containing protein [Thermodesulfovibrionales bacterium]